MTTDLERSLRAALTSRGDAITPATLRRPLPTPPHAHTTRTGTDVALVRPAPVRTPRRVAVTWLTAAAIVIAIAAVATVAIKPASRGLGAGGDTGPGPMLSLPFAANLPTGYRIGSVLADSTGSLELQILTPRKPIPMFIDPPAGADRRFRADARPITLNGRKGYVGATWTDAQYDHHNDTLPADSVSWQYNGVAYASLDPYYTGISPSLLQELASRFDFTKRTPIRVATRLHAIPPGTHLDGIVSVYKYDKANSEWPWESTIVLSLSSSTQDQIRVDLCRCGPELQNTKSRTVNGKKAYVYSGGRGSSSVQVVEGGGVVLTVASSHDLDHGGKWTGTLSVLLDIARSVTITAHPNTPRLWFNAAEALP